jgi:thiamine transport system permease protein
MILLAHVFFNVSVIIRAVGGFWANLNPRLQEAAAVLGANPRRVFTQITLPLLMPSILAASLLVFLFCFTSFGVILILGGLRFATLEVEIYRQSVSLFNLPVAALLALIQLLLTLTVTTVYTRLQARTTLPLDLRPRTATARPPATRREGCLLTFALVLAIGVLMAPLLALAWQSVTLGAEGFTLRYYQELAINRRQSAFFVPPLAAIGNSLNYATQTVILSVLLGVISAYLLTPRRATPGHWRAAIFDPLFLLPLGTYAVTLGFGYILALGSLRASLLLVPIAHTLIAMPFVVRTVLPALRGLDPRWRESATVLGASAPRTWYEIDLPLLARTILVAAAFAFTISLGEFGATLLISRPDHPTMPIAIYASLSRPGLLNYGQAVAMSTLLMLICALGLIAIERLRFGTVGEF